MTNTNEAQIKNLIEKWAMAIQNEDVSRMLAYHNEDVVLYDVPFSPQSNGLEAYKRTWELYFSFAKEGSFEISNMKIIAGDDLGHCYGLMRCSSGAGSNLTEGLTFRLTACFIKKNNVWLICHEHHSLIPECTN